MAAQDEGRRIVVGRVAGAFGAKEWWKIYSYTVPSGNILDYAPWQLLLGGNWVTLKRIAGRPHGKGVVAQFEGYDDRAAAATLFDCDIAVMRDQLPDTQGDEIYWADLIGLRVVTVDGIELGVIDHLLETGANDVVVVKGERERLLPYVDQVVREVDLDGGVMRVDWDPEF